MNDLPQSWEVCTVADITLRVQTVPANGTSDREIAYVDISSIDNLANRISTPKRLKLSEAPSRARQVVKTGDVLFSTVRPYLRNIAAVPSALDGEIASTGFAVLRAADGVDPAYLFYKATSRDFVAALTGEQYGVSYPAVKEEQVRAQPFELPPTREQRRIVAKIEELFSELDKAVESLTLARAQLKTYRQALLKAAFEGKLTADWRAANPYKLQPPETLLARIRAEREARQVRALGDWRKAVANWQAGGEVGRKPTKPRPFNVDLSAVANGDDSMEKLPFGWVWLRLNELCDESPKNGVYKPASDYGKGIQIVRIDDFYDGRLIRKSGFKQVALTSEEEEDYAVAANDLIVNRVNSIEYLGKCALIPALDAATVFESNIMRLRPSGAAVRADWLTRYLSSAPGQDRMRENAKHAVNQASINQNDVGLVRVPYCPLAEQGEIVAVLDETLSAVETTDREIGDAFRRVGALRQSILKKAFSGQLVSQDATDEPAAALLARLREQAPAPRTRRRKIA